MIKDLKVIAADIDMTLTAKGGDLPASTKEAFEILHKNNVLIGLATGRVIEEKEKQMAKSWGLSFDFDFIVGMNGGMVYNKRTNSMWSCDMLSTDEMKDILVYMMPIVDKYKIGVNVEGGGNHSAMNIQGELLESARRHGFEFDDKTGDIDGFCYTPAYKFLFRGEAEHEQELRDTFLNKFGDNYQIVSTFPGTVEVMHKGIDKGSGIARYVIDEGLTMEQVMTFGDNENDNTMLKDAGWGVCLSNGADKTKACADDITELPCEDGGVGDYLLKKYIEPNHLK